jgi:YidC/Oxa1 family membrane protein insertase
MSIEPFFKIKPNNFYNYSLPDELNINNKSFLLFGGYPVNITSNGNKMTVSSDSYFGQELFRSLIDKTGGNLDPNDCIEKQDNYLSIYLYEQSLIRTFNILKFKIQNILSTRDISLDDFKKKEIHSELKEKYKDNQQKLAEETMKIWQEHKVNPMSGCLPILIQFPILIALFFVVQDGLNPDQSVFLYEPLKDFVFQNVSTNFLGLLELTKQNFYVLPFVVGGLQFSQLYLANNRNKKQKAKTKSKDQNQDQMQSVQNTMLYFMPAMIAVITATLPAGVGLYWGTSTLFAIMQQVIINKETNPSS